MEYRFENLGPEQFQDLCQALLVKAYPDLQCFPVAQPDGGRDGLSYYATHAASEFAVFQVKYVRRPMAEPDPHNWLVGVLEKELPKITKLIPDGASKYFLLTNVPGTAHLESGSIDRTQRLLAKHIPVPSQCLWRNDLARRLDGFADLRWAFPTLITPGDILKVLLESGLTEAAERRINALRAAIRHQFAREKEVRFKQIELQNKLLDLFIDIPVTLRSGPKRQVRQLEWHMRKLSRLENFRKRRRDEEDSVGVATLLLNGPSQSAIQKLVLEGGPGQGKSTVTQYICQIHRRRILGESVELPQIPTSHQSAPARLPFKVDLRDLSLWLQRKNPFSGTQPDELPQEWHGSLESFLASQIHYHSGGMQFAVDDLHAICRAGHVMVVLDGLDEVGDIARRKEVVQEVTKASNRLNDVAASLQVLITSRPAASSQIPAFSESQFCHIELNSIPRRAIDDYSQRWLKARKLDGTEAATVRRILREKLDQPHLRELARNPMQLAILLSLIHTRGSSLPDKRTALYDAYMELFFSREAEKSEIVREHRELLIDIHRYLAWVLHAEAEASGDSGSVTEGKLKEMVSQYLTEEEHDASIVEDLFTGMVERVVALVSRVEGTFEFEVQPLREYFAARHLYETAPYAPTGVTRPGTLPDRFDALVRNPYWWHVTRFFAGCYNKGELPSLVDRIESLAEDPDYRYSRYAQDVAVPLLSDWVFTQQPKSKKKIIDLLVSGTGLRHLLSASSRRARRYRTIVLPNGCGGDELVAACFEELKDDPPADYADILCDTLKENADHETLKGMWIEHSHQVNAQVLSRWCIHGRQLGVLAHLSDSDVERLLDEAQFPERVARLHALVTGGMREYFESSEEAFDEVVDRILDRDLMLMSPNKGTYRQFDVLNQCMNGQRISNVFEHRPPYSLIDTFWRYEAGGETFAARLQEAKDLPYENVHRIGRVRDVFIEEGHRSAEEWATTLGPWENLIERLRAEFGDRWGITCLAAIGAGIRSTTERAADYGNLSDASVSLVHRFRHARMKAGSPLWWEKQLSESLTATARLTSLLLFWTWSGPETLKKLLPLVDGSLELLSSSEWQRLVSAVRYCRRATNNESKSGFSLQRDDVPEDCSARTITLLDLRTDEKSSGMLFDEFVGDVANECVSQFVQRIALRRLLSGEDAVNASETIAKTYKSGVLAAPRLRYYRPWEHYGVHSEELATKIVQDPGKFPCDLVSVAALKFRQKADANVTPLAETAHSFMWFSEFDS